MSLGLADVSAALGLAQRRATQFDDGTRIDAVLGRGALERHTLAHTRDCVRDVLDRQLRAARQLIEFRERFGQAHALTAAPALWYLWHSIVRKRPRLAGPGLQPLVGIREVVCAAREAQPLVGDRAAAFEVRLSLREFLITFRVTA